jgi:hypothetical protein
MNLNELKHHFSSDTAFDSLYPIHIQKLSAIHWTPLHVAVTAARFLALTKAARVLDIGAGVGKFCITGGVYTKGTFTGIEQRKNFVQAGNKVIKQMMLSNVALIHGNFTDLDLTQYTGIYFYNSFHENIVLEDSLDERVERSSELYTHYTNHLLDQLNNMPAGTRLATYWLSITEIPDCYRTVEQHYGNHLKLWIKER